MSEERLREFTWAMLENGQNNIRDVNGNKPAEVELMFNPDWLFIKWESGGPRIAYTQREAEAQLRMTELFALRVILRDDWQSNGAFVRPEIWDGCESDRDRSEVVTISIKPKQKP